MRLTFEDITGGSAHVLSALADDAQFKSVRNLNPVVAMTMARNISEELASNFCVGLVKTALETAYLQYEVLNGEHATLPDQAARDEWESGIDDVVEKIFEPYEKMLSADWLGRHTIDTRLHQRVKGQPDDLELGRLCDSFAKEVWKCLIHYTDKDNDDKLAQMTTAQILEAVGVARSDVEALIKERPEPTVQQEEAHVMSNFGATAVKLKEFIELSGMDEKAVVALLENAIDSDNGLAASGIQQLGGDMSDVKALREIVASLADGADDLYDIIMKGETQEDYLPVSDNATGPAGSNSVDEDAELLRMMGGGDAAPAAQPAAGALPPPGAGVGAPPPPTRAGGRRGAKTGEPVVGGIPARAFELIRAHVKVKDEDVGGMLGVSRQTYINYGKGKPVLVPSPEQKNAMLDMIDTALKGLTEARALVAAV